ncbi:hypothetical protein [Micromonospora sp. KLBMP9576]|uniref:hypothetical protein n=1 Tax=Micromonospora sp. KLBMP9576 TaxID=3424769 RepID=UPI003D91119F
MKKRISGLLAIGLVSALMGLSSLPQAAMAADEKWPKEGSAGGVSVIWWYGHWEGKHRMSGIDFTLCDGNPDNTNEATAAVTVQLRNPTTGEITWETAPARAKIYQYERPCQDFYWEVGYAKQLRAVKVNFWGDESPSSGSSTPWSYNPNL